MGKSNTLYQQIEGTRQALSLAEISAEKDNRAAEQEEIDKLANQALVAAKKVLQTIGESTADVNDEAGVILPDQFEMLKAKLAELEEQYLGEMIEEKGKELEPLLLRLAAIRERAEIIDGVISNEVAERDGTEERFVTEAELNQERIKAEQLDAEQEERDNWS